ncbi:MAG: Hpt domain-containing protein [Desulfomonile tiedjei]|nr:Hpt domain-containing protein [Desulfomonile tiedjei]
MPEHRIEAYVSKLINVQEFQRTLERIMHELEPDARQILPTPTKDSVLDRAGILDRVGGDAELLKEVVGLFIDDCPRLLSEIREAFLDGDAARVEKVAHALKGSVGNFAAEAAVQAAFKLESMGRSRDLTGASEALMQLEREIDWVKEELVTLDQEVRLENTGG